MINRGAAAFQEAFDKRVTTLRGRRAKNREIFDKYVEDAVASGRRVDAKELASFANQISGGDSYLTGEIPQGEILTAFTDRANARVEIKELEERFAKFEQNEKEGNMLAKFQLQNFDMSEEDFTQAGQKQFGKAFGGLMQRVGGYQGLKERNRDVIIKKATSDSRFALLKNPGDAEKIFKEIKDPIILANLNNVGQQRATEKFNRDSITIIDYLDKVPEVDLRNPDSKSALIAMAMSRIPGGTSAERAKLEKIATDHLGMRVGSATKEFARVQQVQLDARHAKAAGAVVKTLLSRNLIDTDPTALKSLVEFQLRAEGIKDDDENFDSTVEQALSDYQAQRGFAVGQADRTALMQARTQAAKFAATTPLGDWSEAQLEGHAKSILAGNGLTETSAGYSAALEEITTALKGRRTSDIGVRVRSGLSSIPAFATNLTKGNLSDRTSDFSSDWQNALLAAGITEKDLGENASRLKRNFINTLQKDRDSDIAEVTREREAKFSAAVMGDKNLSQYLISVPVEKWGKYMPRIRQLATAAGVTLPEDPIELETDPLIQNIIGEANELSRLTFRKQRQAQIASQRKAIEERVESDIKNTAAMVEAMTRSEDESARNIGGVIKGNNIIMTNAQAALAQTYAEEALAEARGQGEVSAAEGNNIVMAAIQKAGGRTRSQVMQSATESILGYEMDTDMFAETNKEIESFRAALLDLPDWLRDQGPKARKAVESKMRKSYNRIKSSLQDWPNGVYKNTREAGQRLGEMERLIDKLKYAEPSPKPPKPTVNLNPDQRQASDDGGSRPGSPADIPLTRQALTKPVRGPGRSRRGDVDLLGRVADMANNGPNLLNMNYDEAEVVSRLPPSVQSAFQQWVDNNPPPQRRRHNMPSGTGAYKRKRAKYLHDLITSGDMEAQLQGQNAADL